MRGSATAGASLSKTKRQLLVTAFAIYAGIGTAAAQESTLGAVRPGEVATVIPQLVLGKPTPAHYTITPTAGFRLLGPDRGVLSPGESGAPRLPITFVTPADAPAGRTVAARISVQWPDGGPYAIDVPVQVEGVRRLELQLTAPAPTVRRDAESRLSYRLKNAGNATDTVRLEVLVGGGWRVSELSGSQLLPPKDSVAGRFTLRVPAEAVLGEQRLVRLRTGSGEGHASASVALTVVDQDEAPFGLARVPASVFIGGTNAGTELNGSLLARGYVGPETEIGIELRHVGSQVGLSTGQTDLWGSPALLTVRHRQLDFALGEMSLPMDGLARGTRVATVGAFLREGGDGWLGEAIIARPRTWGGSLGGGHLLAASLGHRIGAGALSARAMEMDRGESGIVSVQKEQLLGVRYSLVEQGRHRLSVETGVIRQTSADGDAAVGAALDALYGYLGPNGSLGMTLRRVPAPGTMSSASGDEATVNASIVLLPQVRASAAAHLAARPPRLGGVPGEARGASAGLHLGGLGSSLGLTASVRETTTGISSRPRRREAGAATLSTGLGPVSLTGSMEVGMQSGSVAGSGRFLRWRGQVRWSRGGESFWFGLDDRHDPLYTSPLQLHAGTRFTSGRLTVDAMAGGAVADRAIAHSSLRVGADYAISRSVSLIAGTEYRVSLLGYSPPTVSFGIRKDLRLPLPIRERPALRGVVFEDLNGNGRRDRGEPGVEGIAISAGSARMTTDRQGGFQSRANLSTGTPVHLHLGSRLGEYIAPSVQTVVPQGARIEMPLVRPAAVDLLVFDDRNDDGTLGLDDAAPTNIIVMLHGPRDRSYSRIADAAGRAHFGAVMPGEYRLVIQQGARKLMEAPLILAPGEQSERQVPVHAQIREIRMWTPQP